MTARWRTGNHAVLLENGEDFYPAVFEAIRNARHEVIVETFILDDDHVGRGLSEVLTQAARRGVRVEVTLDAWGSMALSQEFLAELTGAGVCLHLFEEKRPRWLLRVSWFRRLHRKLVVVDGQVAFVGGINFSRDHLTDFGAQAKQDYAVRVTGPVVGDIHAFARYATRSVHHHDDGGLELPPDGSATGSMQGMFIVRDNRRGHRSTIEKHYRAAIKSARHRLVIANAYFFPGHLLLREIRNAARRGVDVRLITQAKPDLRIASFGARLLYDYLLRDGVRIYEYTPRQFHGKVAVIDDDWATVGSSNLDPLSLWFNLEANVLIRDQRFNRIVREKLEILMNEECRQITRDTAAGLAYWRVALGFVAYHLLRRFPRLAGLLPAHRPRLTRVPPARTDATRDEAA